MNISAIYTPARAALPWLAMGGHQYGYPGVDKKGNQIFLIYKEILNGAVAKSYMTNGLNICAFPHILGSPSSYMTLQLFHSEFPYPYEEN